MRRSVLALVALAALSMSGVALAHTAWLERDPARPNAWRLYFGGHEGRLEPADPAKLRDVTALDARGRPLRVSRAVNGDQVAITVAGRPSVLALHYDNGFHSRTATAGPSVPRPMNQVPGAVSAVWAVKYAKTIVSWSPAATRPVGQAFEVVPMEAVQPRAGRPMRLQVRQDGRPAAGVTVARGENVGGSVTDANGVATYTPAAGLNRLWAGRRIETTRDPRYTQLSYEYALVFEAAR